jgi:spermidine synthase
MVKQLQVVAIYPNKYDVVFTDTDDSKVKEFAKQNRDAIKKKGAIKVIVNLSMQIYLQKLYKSQYYSQVFFELLPKDKNLMGLVNNLCQHINFFLDLFDKQIHEVKNHLC